MYGRLTAGRIRAERGARISRANAPTTSEAAPALREQHGKDETRSFRLRVSVKER
jgi:hypothetical protein